MAEQTYRTNQYSKHDPPSCEIFLYPFELFIDVSYLALPTCLTFFVIHVGLLVMLVLM